MITESLGAGTETATAVVFAEGAAVLFQPYGPMPVNDAGADDRLLVRVT